MSLWSRLSGNGGKYQKNAASPGVGSINGTQYKYWAFISYSHRDKKWGDWLIKSLETYKVSEEIISAYAGEREIPKRIFPVFRDREALPTAHDLSENIKQALADSEYLIVICSPNAVGSKYVNDEIKAFKALGRENKVLCLIVDGEPNASSKTEIAQKASWIDKSLHRLGLLSFKECFPEAIRFKVNSETKITSESTEPIAADARKGKDGKLKALVKLIAGVLRIDFDKLWQREQRRKRRNQTIISIVMASLMLVFAGLAWLSWRSYQRAEQAKIVAEQARAETRDSLMTSLIQAGEGDIRGDDIHLATARFEKAASFPQPLANSNEYALSAQILAGAWKRSLTYPVKLIPMGKDGQRLTTSDPDVYQFFQPPDRFVTVHSNLQVTSQKLPLSTTNMSRWWLDPFQIRIIEMSEDLRKLRTHMVASDKQTTVWKNLPFKVECIIGSESSSRLALLDEHRTSLCLVDTERDWVSTPWTVDAMILSVLIRSDLIWVGLSSGEVVTLNSDGNPLQPQKRMAFFKNGINNFQSNPKGRYVALLAERHVVICTSEMKEITRFSYSSIVSVVRFSKDEQWLCIADVQGHTFLYQLDQRITLAAAHQFPAGVRALEFSRDSRLVAFILDDRSAYIQNVSPWQTTSGRLQHDAVLVNLGFSADNLFYTIDETNGVSFWRQPNLAPAKTSDYSLTVALGDQGIASVEAGVGLTIRNVQGVVLNQINANLGTPVRVEATQDGRFVAAATTDGDVTLFDLRIGSATFFTNDKFVAAISFLSPSQRLAIGDDNGTLSILNLETGVKQCVRYFPSDRVDDLTSSQDGLWMAVFLSSGKVHILATSDFQSQTESLHFTTNRCRAPTPNCLFRPVVGAFSPNSRYFLTSGDDGKVKVISMDGNKTIAQADIGEPVYALTWGHDSRQSYISTITGRVLQMDVTDDNTPVFITRIGDVPRQLAIIGAGKILLASGNDGSLVGVDLTSKIRLGLPVQFQSNPKILSLNSLKLDAYVSEGRSPLIQIDYGAVPEVSIEKLVGIYFDREGLPIRKELKNVLDESLQNFNPVLHKSIIPISTRNSKPSKRLTLLNGLWKGDGVDQQVATWRFELVITTAESGELNGKFSWWRTAAMSSSNPIGFAGYEDVSGTFDPSTGIISLQSSGVDSNGGLGGCVWYHGYVDKRHSEIRHGTWSFPGSFWGIWSAKKTSAGSGL